MGKKTTKKRDSLKVYFWMKENGLSYVGIARDLGYGGHMSVWRTVNGKKNIRKVLQYLVDRGCPKGILALPTDMETIQ